MNLDDFCRVGNTQKNENSFGSGTILLIGIVIIILIFALRRRSYPYPYPYFNQYPGFFAGGYEKYAGYGRFPSNGQISPESYAHDRKHHHHHHRRNEYFDNNPEFGYGDGYPTGQGYGAPDQGYNAGYDSTYGGFGGSQGMPNQFQQY